MFSPPGEGVAASFGHDGFTATLGNEFVDHWRKIEQHERESGETVVGARLDHITVVAPNLEVGAAYVGSALGVLPGAGRTHPGMGTHNLLLSLGRHVYLEVIAVDPAAPAPGRARWFGLDHLPSRAPARLSAWVASTEDIAKLAVPDLGEVETMCREHVSWQMTVRPDGDLPLDGAAPLLIQRSSSATPAATLPSSGLLLLRLRISHPEPSQVAALLARGKLTSESPVIVSYGPECRLVADVQTSSGVRALGEI
jgi:hypothetical protein